MYMGAVLLDELFTPGTVWVLHVLDTALRRGTCRIEKVKIERMHGAEAARSRWNAAVSALAASTFVRGSGRTYFVFCFGGIVADLVSLSPRVTLSCNIL